MSNNNNNYYYYFYYYYYYFIFIIIQSDLQSEHTFRLSKLHTALSIQKINFTF